MRKHLNYSKSKWVLISLSIAIIVVSFVIKKATPRARLINNVPLNLDLKTDLDSVLPLYQLKSSMVQIYKGTMDTLDFGTDIGVTAMSISTKLDLDAPYNSNSLDSKVSKRIAKYNNTDFNTFISSRKKLRPTNVKDKLYKEIIKDKCWVTKIPSEYNSPKPIYFVAAIPALTEDELKANKETLVSNDIIRIATKKLIIKAQNEYHLAIPIFGTGAAGLSFKKAIPAIFTGINEAIYENNKAPEKITLVLWPGTIWEMHHLTGNWPVRPDSNSKFAKLSDTLHYVQMVKQSRDFKYLGRIIQNHINPEIINNPRYEVWGYSSIIIWLWQIFMLSAIPIISALLHLKFSKQPLTFGMIVTSIVISLFLITGLNIGQELVLKSPPSISNFIVISLAVLISTLWKWNKMGEAPEKENKSM